MKSFLVGNIWYTILDDFSVRTGKESTSNSGNAFNKRPENNANIVIPSTITDSHTNQKYTVTKIGMKSFQGLNANTYYKFNIPETVT